MRWLTLTDIKDQLNINQSNTLYDTKLTRKGNAAEQFVLDYLCRTEDELKAMNPIDPTKVPDIIVEATLLIVCEMFEHNSPLSMQNLYLVPYGFDALVSHYRKGTYSSVDDEED